MTQSRVKDDGADHKDSRVGYNLAMKSASGAGQQLDPAAKVRHGLGDEGLIAFWPDKLGAVRTCCLKARPQVARS